MGEQGHGGIFFKVALFDLCATFSSVQFEWDENKAAKNLAKHGVEFAQAVAVFADPHQLTVEDSRHKTEHRENTTGAAQGVIFIVCHTHRAGLTRIISARHASRQKRKHYNATY